jgi:hypothetical protein
MRLNPHTQHKGVSKVSTDWLLADSTGFGSTAKAESIVHVQLCYGSMLGAAHVCACGPPTWSTLCTAVLQDWLALYAAAASAISSSRGCLLVPNILMRNVSINNLQAIHTCGRMCACTRAMKAT